MISLKKWTFAETPENKGNKLRKMPQAYFMELIPIGLNVIFNYNKLPKIHLCLFKNII